MSEYIRCPKCFEDTLDVDCLRCDCGYSSSDVGPARVFADADNNGLNARVLPVEHAALTSNLETERKRMEDFYRARFGPRGTGIGWGRDKRTDAYLGIFAEDAWAAWQAAQSRVETSRDAEDAARYRWLRDFARTQGKDQLCCWIGPPWDSSSVILWEGHLDRTIDMRRAVKSTTEPGWDANGSKT